MEKYVVLDKKIGETPLSCTEAWRVSTGVDASVPLAYAGRLDPMASGKLLVLIGDECKHQTNYHGLDKEYEFSVLFGIESDTQDVLGRLQTCIESSEDGSDQPSDRLRLSQAARSGLSEGSIAGKTSNSATEAARHTFETRPAGEGSSDAFQKQSSQLQKVAKELTGKIELPYPHFSSKTVQGKPLHMWTLEGRLGEIEIPTKESEIYSLDFVKLEIKSREHIADEARAKIDTIPEVTDPRKALGNDFRRKDVRADWENIKNDNSLPDSYHIAHFSCLASSGTYMRTLASVIAEKLNAYGLAWHIHRTRIGKYNSEKKTWDFEY